MSRWPATPAPRRSTACSTCSGRPRRVIRSRRTTCSSRSTTSSWPRRFLKAGADVNARLTRTLWYTTYNRDLLGVDRTGATAFWLAAYTLDIPAMQLLLKYGADPNIRTAKVPERYEEGGPDPEPARSVGAAADPVARPGGGADSRRLGRRLRPGLRRQHPSPRARRLGAGGDASWSRSWAPTSTPATTTATRRSITRRRAATTTSSSTSCRRAPTSRPSPAAARPRWTWPTGRCSACSRIPETVALLESLGAINNHRCVSC